MRKKTEKEIEQILYDALHPKPKLHFIIKTFLVVTLVFITLKATGLSETLLALIN